jgi:hypothetical protein
MDDDYHSLLRLFQLVLDKFSLNLIFNRNLTFFSTPIIRSHLPKISQISVTCRYHLRDKKSVFYSDHNRSYQVQKDLNGLSLNYFICNQQQHFALRK